MTTYYKTLKGYTTQARWMAANLEGPDGSWVEAGWTKLGNGAVKPVYRMTNGTQVVLLDGKTHLHVVVSEVPAGCVVATEDEAFAMQAGW